MNLFAIAIFILILAYVYKTKAVKESRDSKITRIQKRLAEKEREDRQRDLDESE